MQKLTTKEELEKKSSRNKTILSIVLGALMLLSTAGYALYRFDNPSIQKKIKYNNIEFSFLDDGYWHFTINNKNFATQYNPIDTANISSVLNIRLANYNSKNLYFSYDSNRFGAEEILRNIGNYADRVQYACLEECKEDLPVKNCSDNIIIIQNINETLIKQEDACVYILADSENAVKASDKFIFSILGI